MCKVSGSKRWGRTRWDGMRVVPHMAGREGGGPEHRPRVPRSTLDLTFFAFLKVCAVEPSMSGMLKRGSVEEKSLL